MEAIVNTIVELFMDFTDVLECITLVEDLETARGCLTTVAVQVTILNEVGGGPVTQFLVIVFVGSGGVGQAL